MSITVDVQLLSIFRALAGGVAGCAVCLAEGATVGDLLAHLGETYGQEFRQAVLAADGRLAPHATVLLNGENITMLQGVATRLESGDRLTVLLAITGG